MAAQIGMLRTVYERTHPVKSGHRVGRVRNQEPMIAVETGPPVTVFRHC
jgi:hypothetical protein